MKQKMRLILLFVLLISVLLVSCAGAQPTPAVPIETEASIPTEAIIVTSAPAVPEEPPQPLPGGENHLVLATTTSTEDSGLLDFLLPDFEQETGAKVDVIAVGTGQALQLGEDGNADVLLVHARAKEDEFMAAGHGVRREDVMYNDFVILGPEDDPAGIKGNPLAADVFKMIADANATFISRGDESGTHTKEKSIWKAAGLEPSGDWYISSGQGMGEVLTMANEQQAYTLSDRATFLARTKQGLDLVILAEGDPILFNPYGIISVNPGKNPNIQSGLGEKFIDWMISIPTQEKIASFGIDEFGQSLFIPDSTLWRESQVDQNIESAATEPAIKITGLVANQLALTEEEVRSLPNLSVESTNKQGEKVTSTGVLLSELLNLAGPASDASSFVFVADDGYTAEGSLAEIMACENCILAFRDEGGFSIVMPDFPGSLQVRGVIEIQVK